MVFVWAEYAARDWTRLKRRAALDRSVRERREYVLSARFDDTPLPGLFSGTVVVDLRTRTPQRRGEQWLLPGGRRATGRGSEGRAGADAGGGSGQPAPRVRPAERRGEGRVAGWVQRGLGLLGVIDAIGTTEAWLDGVPSGSSLMSLGRRGVTDVADTNKIASRQAQSAAQRREAAITSRSPRQC